MEYGKPKVLDYGELSQLTAGELSGTETDAKFEDGTPTGDLRFTTP